MDVDILLLFGSIIILCIGVVLGYFTRQGIAKKQLGSAEEKINKMLSQAKTDAKDVLEEAQKKSLDIIEDAKKEERERLQTLRSLEQRLDKRENILENKLEESEKKLNELKAKAEQIRSVKEETDKLKGEVIEKLQKVANLSKEDARDELLSRVEKEYADLLVERVKKLEETQYTELEEKAKNIMTWAMQRYAASQSAEISTSSINLPSDDLKGRIIGKEGRNIKTLEKLTGVEVIVDDTPGAIVLSSFDPVRRQIAKMALEKLMNDGRIQPARIEETVQKAEEEIGKKIESAGQAAVFDAGVAGLDPKLVKLIGRLTFRTSYGQNVLLHSLEVAHLAGAIAAELGADVTVAKKAGLLHDIGKAVDHEVQGSHVEIGRMIMKKFGVSEEVIKAMQAHHEEHPFETVESVIVQVADKLSGARPGARKDTLEAYLKRLEELEKIANTFPGIDKTYAIQAGREIRVFVQPEKMDDFSAKKLARDIADKIESELKYPGEIKVTVIRETRVVEFAR